MKDNMSRRAVGRMLGAGSLTALASRTALAQFSQAPKSPSICPPGMRLERFEVTREITHIEFSINLTKFGGGGTVKMPTSKIAWKAICVDNAPPPQPPRPGGNVWDDLATASGYLQLFEFDTLRPDAYFVGLAIPAFAAPVLTNAKADLQALRVDGTKIAATFALTQAAGGIVFASPGEVAQWAQAVASNAISGSISVRDVGVMAYSQGSATYGLVHYLAGRPMAGFSGTLTAGLSTGVPPRMNAT